MVHEKQICCRKSAVILRGLAMRTTIPWPTLLTDEALTVCCLLRVSLPHATTCTTETLWSLIHDFCSLRTANSYKKGTGCPVQDGDTDNASQMLYFVVCGSYFQEESLCSRVVLAAETLACLHTS